MNRRKFTTAMGAVVAGVAAGSKAFAEEKKADAGKKADAKAAKHICKGHNECKGQGGCASDAAKHSCAGKNDCKGMGGCKSGDNGCGGQERLQGQGRLLRSGEPRALRQEGQGLLQGQGRLQELRSGNRFGLPDLGIGVGLRTVHFGHILAQKPEVDWFEVLSENFLDTGGRPLHVLDQVAERYPVVLHGVSLSIGSVDPLDRDYLRKLKALAARTRARWVSDHLCWTGVVGRNVHDLLPMPLHRGGAAAHRRSACARCSDILERPLVLENPSTYVEFASSTMPECGVPRPARRGRRLRPAAGREQRVRERLQPRLRPRRRTSTPCPPIAWCSTTWRATPTTAPTSSTRTATTPCPRSGSSTPAPAAARAPSPRCYEWDENIPAFEVVHAEALKARAYRTHVDGGRGLMPRVALGRLQRWMQAVIVHPGTVDDGIRSPAAVAEDATVEDVVRPSARLTAAERVGIYHGMYLGAWSRPWSRTIRRSRRLLGAEAFADLVARLRPGAPLAELYVEPPRRPPPRVRAPPHRAPASRLLPRPRAARARDEPGVRRGGDARADARSDRGRPSRGVGRRPFPSHRRLPSPGRRVIP